MTRIIFLLLAALLPSAIWAQNTKPLAPKGSAQAEQQPQSQAESLDDDPAFKRLTPQQQDWVRTMTGRLNTAVEQKDINSIEQLKLDLARHQILGMTLCGHLVDEGTFVDAVVLNRSSEEANAIRWLDPTGTAVHSAIFTGRKRCVVSDGDTVDGKPVVRALPNSLAVSNQHALTAWEGEYWNSPAEKALGGAPRRAVYIENRFLAELDPHKASPLGSRDLSDSDKDRDFRWNDDRETLAVKPELVLASSTASPAPAKTAASPCVVPAKKASFLDKLKQHAERTLEKQTGKADADIAKGTKGNVDGGVQDTTTTAVNEADQPQPCTPPAKGQPAKQ